MPKFAVRIVALMVVGLLVACSSYGPTPSRKLVKKAIALQLSQTQATLTQQLNLDSSPPFEINRIRIHKREPLIVEDLTTFHIAGDYDLTLTLSDRDVQQKHNPFEVYLQRQIQGQTWRLVKRYRDGTGYSYLLPN
ncbi:hypothetical protein QM565_31040 [Geitlerinema splendidum]|nr:hypothetical protein [Geitlerinema splendidum]